MANSLPALLLLLLLLLMLLMLLLLLQVPDVQAAYGPYFDDFEVSTEGSWACVTAVRKADH
jgi:hypothetical protein